MLHLVAALALAASDPARALCRGRGPCQVLSSDAAGSDADGLDLTVVRLALTDAPLDGPPEAANPCVPEEVWLVRARGGKKVDDRRLLEICNDGHGASMIGEDRVAAGPNTLVYTVNGGAAWRWRETSEVRLSPLRPLVEYEEGSYFTNNQSLFRWDWERFAGRAEWSAPLRCDGSEDRISGAYAPIPRVTVPVADANAWREAALGGCALHVDATGGDGFVVAGEAGDASDAAMSLVFGEPTTLWVELSDDVRVEDAADPAGGDHLELWIGPAKNRWDAECLPEGEGAIEWIVPLGGGPAQTGYVGAVKDMPTPPTVDRQGSRLRIQLPEPPAAITVAYADADDAATGLERVIATSALAFGDARTLGALFDVRPERATCGVVDGRLEPRPVDGWAPR